MEKGIRHSSKLAERIPLQVKIAVATTAGSLYMIVMVALVILMYGGDAAPGTAMYGLRARLLPVFISALAGGVLVSHILVRVLVRRPIMKAVTAAEGVALGDFSRNLYFPSRDELGLLAESFNSMLSHLGHLVSNVKAGTRNIKGDDQAIEGYILSLGRSLEVIADAALKMLEVEKTGKESGESSLNFAEAKRVAQLVAEEAANLKDIQLRAAKLGRTVANLETLLGQFKLEVTDNGIDGPDGVTARLQRLTAS